MSGDWAKGSNVENDSKCKLVSETNPVEGEYGMQDIAKIRFQGEEGEARNVRINQGTMNALIDAFGEDSAKWQGNLLTAKTEKMRVAGKAVTALFLVPEGYEIGDDENGYLVITKVGGDIDETASTETTGASVPGGEINPDDIPF